MKVRLTTIVTILFLLRQTSHGTIICTSSHLAETVICTQIESPGQETADSRVFRRFHGSSIPADKSGDRIYPVPSGTDRNLSKLAAGYGNRIPWVKFLAFSCWLRPETASFLRVFAGNPQNTASGIIVLGNVHHYATIFNNV